MVMTDDEYRLSIGLTEQEGWLSPTELASVSAISLRHNLATGTLRDLRRYVVAFTRVAGGGDLKRV